MQKAIFILFLVLFQATNMHGHHLDGSSKIDSLLAKAWYYNSFETDSALNYSKKALELSTHVQDSFLIAKSLRYCAIAYRKQGKFTYALRDLYQALEIDELNGYKTGSDYLGIGNVYYGQKNYEKTQHYWELAYNKYLDDGDLENQSSVLNNLSALKLAKTDYFGALFDLKKCLSVYEELQSYDKIAQTHLSLGGVYKVLGSPAYMDTAYMHYQKSLQLFNSMQDFYGIGSCLVGMSQIESQRKQYDKAEANLLEALSMFQKINNVDNLVYCYGNLGEFYENQKQFEKALFYKDKYYELQDSILNNKIKVQTAELEIKYNTEKKERKIAEQELIMKRQKEAIRLRNIIGTTFIISFLLLGGLIYVLVKRYREKNRTNNIILHQKEKLEEHSRKIDDSIDYARNIQNAILPTQEQVNEYLGEHFIIYKPKDVVSGDFYWVHQQKPYTFFALADCTGHGVPGAFMSMLGTALLNQVVIDGEVVSPDNILNKVKTKLVSLIKKKGKSLHQLDGMNICILVSKEGSNTIEFAGAFHPVYIATKNPDFYQNLLEIFNFKTNIYTNEQHPGKAIIEIKGDMIPVGKSFKDVKAPFSKVTLEVQDGDIFYTLSDGYVDQLGGPNNKKFMVQRLKDQLLDVFDQPMQNQEAILKNAINTWIEEGSIGQIDDISLAGIRFIRPEKK